MHEVKCLKNHLLSSLYLARIHGLFGWKASPLTLGDLVSNLVNMVEPSLGHEVDENQLGEVVDVTGVQEI